MEIERRLLNDSRLEVRAAADAAKANTIRGYAAVFNALSENLGGFREQIAPGAFTDCLDDDVRALINHNVDAVLGRTLSGTLRIVQDKSGLYYEVDLPDTQVARDLLVSIERGDVTQSSFGFRVAPNGDSWDENDDGLIIRTITKIGRLFDVSPVTIPAYTDATVGVRSLESWKQQKTLEGRDVANIVQRQLEQKKRHLRLLA